ncbi:BNR/Asp-box repeat domain protein [Pelomyxa schiedti]|nr:BNR/Asp-box repeat domain protein [Pelomyxa schiedti]
MMSSGGWKSVVVIVGWCLLFAHGIAIPSVNYELILPMGTFPYCHACSLQELHDGTIVVVFHAGSSEDAEDVAIYTSRRDPSSGVWSDVEEAVKIPGVCNMNPSLFLNDDGTLFLDFHYGSDSLINPNPNKCDPATWSGAYVSSVDGGITWSNITYLADGFLAGIKNKCITLSNNKVLCPSSTESGEIDNLIGVWQSHMETTDQQWVNWQRSNDIAMFSENDHYCRGVIQPTLFELDTPGQMLALMRSSCNYLAQSSSSDYGITWPRYASPTNLSNPGAGIDGVRMYGSGSDLGFLLMMNNSTYRRCPLTLAHSGDWGATWEHVVDIETDCVGTYEYPAIVQSVTEPRTAHVCYSYNFRERTMAYARMQW